MRTEKHKCYYIKGKDNRNILVPNCIGASVYGIERCTCNEKIEYIAVKGYKLKPILKVVR